MLPFDVALPTVHPGVSQNYFYRKRRWRCLIPVGIWGCLNIRETHQCSQEPLTHHHHPSKSLFLGRVVIVSKFKSHLKFASAVARAALFVSGKSADHLIFFAGDFCDFCERNYHYGLVVARLLDSVKRDGWNFGWQFQVDLDVFLLVGVKESIQELT